ncbi:hypothetical protein DDZ13_01540 [Coraliomargarita sinensis]|uniref:rRNA methyltransferase n=1 Tax=Coraliomargarita sinensis TaxID=2174842 RepID=A0A317ZIP5_9BACT|nr:class I SAM-dependent methyltransferase [Coraliomargarita sinensis]PXA05584.1 hypothetical protein DDZ13_01540 [Coraliomargarita sinensis]
MRLTEAVHLKLKNVLRSGDTAIDATAGNGHDTLAMAELVGVAGEVLAIDLQASAIEATRERLQAAARLDRVKLITGDHAETLEGLLKDYPSRVSAITFNLGYLPGGVKQVTTQPETTLRALHAAKSLLKPGGILLVTAYRGHTGGNDEAVQVETWMRSLPESDWQIEDREPPTRNPERLPPILWIARKTL